MACWFCWFLLKEQEAVSGNLSRSAFCGMHACIAIGCLTQNTCEYRVSAPSIQPVCVHKATVGLKLLCSNMMRPPSKGLFFKAYTKNPLKCFLAWKRWTSQTWLISMTVSLHAAMHHNFALGRFSCKGHYCSPWHVWSLFDVFCALLFWSEPHVDLINFWIRCQRWTSESLREVTQGLDTFLLQRLSSFISKTSKGTVEEVQSNAAQSLFARCGCHWSPRCSALCLHNCSIGMRGTGGLSTYAINLLQGSRWKSRLQVLSIQFSVIPWNVILVIAQHFCLSRI